MKGKMNKKLMLLIVALLVIGSSAAFAAPANLTTLKGWFADIKIFSNGTQVQLDTKPLVINNTTYVPVRALTNVLNKDIEWKQDTFSIYINDKPDANYNYVLMQLFEKQDQIAKLEAKVKELEAQLAEAKTTKISSLSDMQKYLNKEYATYEKVDFEIVLSGSTKDVKVKIYIDDTKTNDSYWNKLYKSDIEKYVKNIVDDIKYEFKDAKVSGYIENDYTGKTVVDFYTNSSGKLVIDTDYRSSSGSRYYLDDMEYDLNYYYGSYKGVDFDIDLSGDEDEIRVDVYVYEDDWYDLGSYKESYLESIYDEITSEFPYAEIYGYIYDDYYTSDRLESFEFDSRGYVYLYD